MWPSSGCCSCWISDTLSKLLSRACFIEMFKGCCFGGQRLANDSPEFSDKRKIKAKPATKEDGGGGRGGATGNNGDTGGGEDKSTAHVDLEIVEDDLEGIPLAETADRQKEEEEKEEQNVVPGNSSDQLPKDKEASDGTYTSKWLVLCSTSKHMQWRDDRETQILHYLCKAMSGLFVGRRE